MSEYLSRMKSERNLLNDKIVALTAFIYSNEQFDNLHKNERVRMTQQLAHMESYKRVLDERLTCAVRGTD